jgi:hypothetical protein
MREKEAKNLGYFSTPLKTQARVSLNKPTILARIINSSNEFLVSEV